MDKMLSDWSDWKIGKEDLPVIIFGGENASRNESFDTRNKFVRLIDCYGLPPVFKVQSLCGSMQLDRCLPLAYRMATPREVELLTNENSNT